ncbi:membrane-bound serine protease (ClpP class) [Anaerovirgula multivorans]|uniref:Membrane-bound serine protease (ClpP class) n=1 Tax=Anaerovirgula multivorans TaxID=312168 RepID=A0A239IFG3_9FIRM|nr:NfeD family protein [Anaerovirgula multivorans]SNS92297.1 membrane-bound serine protease (ClpP class) [Anaerovirgula multivorans]
MKRRWLIFLTLALLFSILPLQASGSNGVSNVYVIPIEGEIGPAVYEYVKSSIIAAEQDPNAVAIIFEIDTYGGRIDSAEKISTVIRRTGLPTISFVNTKAESAGVLLTISADTIVMAPGSTIGSAEPIPNTEKTLSMWTSLLRAVAQEKGRDPELVAATADSAIEIPGVIEKDRLLNLTTGEAKELKFADYVESDYAGILQSTSIEYSNIVEVPIAARVRLAQIVTSSYVAPILLSLGFIGLLIEIFTAGFGVGGTVSFVAFALYFGGAILAGNAGWAVLMVFFVGLILLLIEAFAPGFGIPGVGGLICVIISIIMASNGAVSAIISLLVSFVLTIIAFILILKYAPRSKHFDRIILGTQLKKEEGYSSTGKYSQYIGQEGIVITYLRPAGTIDVDGEILDVISEGAFIEVGSRVKVAKVEGRRIIVKKIN